MMVPRDKPCGGCPYRAECPSGIWDKSEYHKLAEYDKETHEQPYGVFMCHDARDEVTVCRGWLDTHDKENLISLRLAASMRLLDWQHFAYLPPCGVPMFASGTEAMLAGMAKYDQPGEDANRLMDKLKKKHPDLKSNG